MIQRTDARDHMPRTGSPLWSYLTAVTVAGAVVLASVLARGGEAELRTLAGVPLWWVLVLLVTCGEVWPIVTPGKSVADAATASITFSFAALIYWGLPAAAVLQVAATVIGGTVGRRAVFRNAFNAAQYTISLGAAALVLTLGGAHPGPANPWVPVTEDLPQVALSAIVFFVCNIALVSVAVALHSRAPVLATIRGDLPYDMLVNVALLSAAPLVLVVMHTSAALVPLFLLPLIAVHANAATSVNRVQQAMHDELTRLPNRKFLILKTEEALTEAARLGHRVGLLLLDLDRFKEVNDTFGHLVGDKLLGVVAQRLAQAVRPGDMVARFGGDEFAVLLPRVPELASAREVAVRLRAALAEPIRMETMAFDLDASVGVALYPDQAADFELLLSHADVAMYTAKERRSGVEAYVAGEDRTSPAQLGLQGESREALRAGRLEMYVRPRVMLADGRPFAMEALIRLRDPGRGTVSWAECMPRAEPSYLMRALTPHVITAALDQAAAWWRSGLRIQIAVSVPGSDLLDPALADLIGSSLRQRSLPPEALLLQISERALMDELPHAAGPADALAKMGISLSLEAFGAGCSSLVRLKRLPVSEIMIDSFLVERMLESPDDRVIVGSLVSLVRALRVRCVAAGVASAAIAAALRQIGCDAVQGPHVGEPMDAARATAWLAEHAPTSAPARSPAGATESGAAHPARPGQQPAGGPAEHSPPAPPPQSAAGPGAVPVGKRPLAGPERDDAETISR